MDLGLVLRAVGALCLIGVIAAGALAVASKRFHVEVDPRVEKVLSVLPGANCGACGNPSCFGAAEAIVAGTAKVTSCTAGGQAVADAVADALGLDKCTMSAVASMRHCGGGHDAKRLFSYSGVSSCVASIRVAGGDLACSYGCLGYGDCARACPFGAIVMDKRGLPIIDLDLCTGCEICVRECPRGKLGLLVMGPMSGNIVVRCSSQDKVKLRREYCSKCCIACKKCEKTCPSEAIHVIDMMAVVDYDKCTSCGRCVAACPEGCIVLSGHNAPKSAGLLDGLGSNVEGFHPLPDAEAPIS